MNMGVRVGGQGQRFLGRGSVSLGLEVLVLFAGVGAFLHVVMDPIWPVIDLTLHAIAPTLLLVSGKSTEVLFLGLRIDTGLGRSIQEQSRHERYCGCI